MSVKNSVRNIVLLAFVLISACSVFFEDDISEEKVVVIAPGNNIETEIVTQTFWWNLIKDIDQYRLQVVSPSFDGVETVLLDSLIQGDKYELSLYAGEFQWRVRGENSAYQTGWTMSNFSIVPTDDLSKQRIRLRLPVENHFTNNDNVNFKWDTIPNVDSYEYRAYTGAWEQNLVIDSINIINSSLSLDMVEGEFWWGIRAINHKSESLFSSQRLVVDKTEPTKPELLTPDDDHSQSETEVDFSWNSSDPVWNTVSDSILIYEKISDNSLKLFKTVLVNSKRAKLELDAGKTYQWKVKSVDQAGNEGPYSTDRDITIN